MPFVKLRKSNEAGKEVGILIVNSDQLITISETPSATELQLTDGHPKWVKNTPDEVLALIQKGA
jgi:hypothetical protein